MIRRSILALVMAGAVSGTAAESMAAPILPGQTLFAVAEPDPVGANLVAGGVAIPFIAPTFTGTLTTSVLNNDVSNPFGLNALTFTYLISNDSTSPHAIDRITISSFLGFNTDVSWQVPTTGVDPIFVDRSALGDVIGFSHLTFLAHNSINPGQSSALLVIQTNATAAVPTTAAIIDGSVTTVPSFAPAGGGSGQTPEPATLSVALVGTMGLLMRRRRAS